MMKGKTLTIRLSERRRNKLYLYAAQKDKTITALIEDWIDIAVARLIRTLLA